MLRKALGGAALAGAAGMLAAGIASPAAAEDISPEAGGVNVLSNICLGNWNGSLVDVLGAGNTDIHNICNGWDQNADGVNLASNICAVNWDWQGGLLSAGHVGNLDDYTLCDWTAEELIAK
ncbi:hypothetical protein GCM10027447_19240 [Glycomyces halotolerans]